jgi:signal transduction histidine kinase
MFFTRFPGPSGNGGNIPLRKKIRVAIIACSSIKEEMLQATKDLEDVDMDHGFFKMTCGHPGVNQSRLEDLLEDTGAYDLIILFGSYCIRDIGMLDSVRVRQFESCFSPIIDQEIVDRLTRKGAYLVTPGWLKKWRDRIREWGFDRKTAREYFDESTREIVLLDTFTNDDTEELLREFSEFIDIPYRTIPVGTSKMRDLINEDIRAMRCHLREKDIGRITGEFQKKLSDLTMAQDVFSILSDVTSEKKVIEDFLRFYSMLFAADKITMKDDRGQIHSLNGKKVEGEPQLVSDIDHAGSNMGRIEIYGVRFPEHISSYRTILTGLSNIQGLAISNSRYFDELRRSRNNLEVMNRKLMEMDVIRKQYVSILAHDIGSPISTLILTLQLIREGKFGPIGDRMDDQLDRAMELINKVMKLRSETLLLNRMDMDSLVIDRSGVNLSEMVEEAIGQIKRHGLEKNIEILNKVERDLVIDVDRKKFDHVFDNLLSNSIRYNREGGSVVIESVEKEEGVEITITDNGRGIEEKDLERIFERFYRSGERIEGSTGLGLSIVKELVDAHGGSVRAESGGIGEGSRFIIFLPGNG